MIIYFSATGNNKYLAQTIASKTGENTLSIIKCMQEKIFDITIPENESLGIIIPTYFIGLPSIVNDFLSKVSFNIQKHTYVYTIASYGTTTGYALGQLKNLLNKQNITVNGEFEVKMPDTWTVMFDLTDKNKLNEQQNFVETQLNSIIPEILNKNNTSNTNRIIYKIGLMFAKKMYESQRKTKHLHVLDNCISCSLCEKDCPVNAIELIEGKPVWTTEKCVMCLRCLHRCPSFSIQYDNKTQMHGQYTNPHIKDFD